MKRPLGRESDQGKQPQCDYADRDRQPGVPRPPSDKGSQGSRQKAVVPEGRVEWSGSAEQFRKDKGGQNRGWHVSQAVPEELRHSLIWDEGDKGEVYGIGMNSEPLFQHRLPVRQRLCRMGLRQIKVELGLGRHPRIRAGRKMPNNRKVRGTRLGSQILGD